MAKSNRLDDMAVLRRMPTHNREESRSTSVRVRPIENGYIKSVDKCGPDGYSCKETFHAEKPSMHESEQPKDKPMSGALGEVKAYLNQK